MKLAATPLLSCHSNWRKQTPNERRADGAASLDPRSNSRDLAILRGKGGEPPQAVGMHASTRERNVQLPANRYISHIECAEGVVVAGGHLSNLGYDPGAIHAPSSEIGPLVRRGDKLDHRGAECSMRPPHCWLRHSRLRTGRYLRRPRESPPSLRINPLRFGDGAKTPNER